MNLNELMPQLEELKAEVLKLIEKNNNQQAEIDFLKKEILEKHEDWKHEGQQAANARAEIEALKAKWLDACDAIIEVGKRKAQEQ